MVEIDLHHTRHSEVARVLENNLYEHIQKGTTEIRVITGNSTKMKELVKRILEDYDMSVSEEWNNFGCLIIKMT